MLDVPQVAWRATERLQRLAVLSVSWARNRESVPLTACAPFTFLTCTSILSPGMPEFPVLAHSGITLGSFFELVLLSYLRRRTSESLGAEFESCGFKSRPCDSPEHPGEKPGLCATRSNHCILLDFCLSHNRPISKWDGTPRVSLPQ